MKRMKKLVAALLVVVAMLSLCACGKDMSGSKYCGTWKATVINYAGMDMEAETVLGAFVLTLDEKGKATVEMDGESTSGKWDEAENGIVLEDKISIGGDDKLEFTAEDDKLVLEMEGMLIYFEKQ